MLKEISEMPKKGKFVATWESKLGELESSCFEWVEGKLHIDGGPCAAAPCLLAKIESLGRYTIRVPEFKKIEFKYPWQVERWLCKNPERVLYVCPKLPSDFSRWCQEEGFAVSHVTESPRTRLSVSSYHRNRLVWYIHNGGES